MSQKDDHYSVQHSEKGEKGKCSWGEEDVLRGKHIITRWIFFS